MSITYGKTSLQIANDKIKDLKIQLKSVREKNEFKIEDLEKKLKEEKQLSNILSSRIQTVENEKNKIVEEKDKIIEEKDKEIEELKKKLAHYEYQAISKKNSSNSSIPPSKDEYKPVNLREKNDKKWEDKKEEKGKH